MATSHNYQQTYPTTIMAPLEILPMRGGIARPPTSSSAGRCFGMFRWRGGEYGFFGTQLDAQARGTRLVIWPIIVPGARLTSGMLQRVLAASHQPFDNQWIRHGYRCCPCIVDVDLFLVKEGNILDVAELARARE